MTDIAWDRTVFFLFPPDAVLRHLCAPVLAVLEDHGFEPVRYEVLWHRPPNQDALHERKITSVWKAYFYRQVDLVFELGPSLALLVEDRSAAVDSHTRLRALKGASDPASAAPGTIRRDLRGVNVLLDIVHSSDTPDDSRHEAGVFFGPELGTPLHGDQRELRDLVAMLEAGHPRENREFDQVRAGLRSRVVAAVWHELDAEGRKLAPELAASYRPDAGAELAALLPVGHPLAALLACEFLPDLPGIDLPRAEAHLAVYGVTLDRWERAVLRSSMLFSPLRSG
ncbi:nucleoside-diphosphate kinase [Acrocarpospora catenulata]|uniref:nucleoside-diphosphate kinase n=1 Tax=Acrocarpospora catenulata TaxID=2836182 RepID=UPI001BD985C1|nr:nucleoside-diphosphate kinase [Acrocarpospora catenulata]